MNVQSAVAGVVGHALNGSRKATKYLSPSLIVKASRRHRPDRRQRHAEVLVTVGAPNYAERAFIAACKKAGEPFPVRRVQLIPWK